MKMLEIVNDGDTEQAIGKQAPIFFFSTGYIKTKKGVRPADKQ